jgi:catechol 2,3-dioxygenase
MADRPSPKLDRETTPAAIAAGTAMGTVSLTVSNLERSRTFYETALGLRSQELEDGDLVFGVPGEPALVRLRGDASAPPLDRRATGLFHLALLFPSRPDLAHAFARLAHARWPLDGVADHLVSEALYLSDPDGNGIELYRDRPRDQWRYEGGELQMATLPLDLRDLAGELSDAEPAQTAAPEGTVMGHVHLQVADIPESEAFYQGLLGFDVTTRGYTGALFVSAGGYHHHLGLNTWHSARSGPPAPGSVGLRSYEIVLPDQAQLDRVLDRITAADVPTEAAGPGIISVRDPAGNVVHLRSR